MQTFYFLSFFRTEITFAVKLEPEPMPLLSVWAGLLPLARRYAEYDIDSNSIGARGASARNQVDLTIG